MKLSHSRVLRDVVEVCALVIAGVWGFYVFAYQNVILPSFANPTPTFDVRMRHVGNDGSFAVLRIDETVRNIGTVPVYFLGHAVTVLGMNVAPSTPGADPKASPGAVYEYSQFSGSKVVYRNIIVTSLGDPKSSRGMSLEPAQQFELSQEFYVPRSRFGRLVAWLVVGYTKRNRTIPTTIRTYRNGVMGFSWKADDVFQVSGPMAELDLKAE